MWPTPTSELRASGQQEGLVGVLHELVKAQDGIVRLHHRVGDLGRRDHREGLHDAVRVPWTYIKQRKLDFKVSRIIGVAESDAQTAKPSLCVCEQSGEGERWFPVHQMQSRELLSHLKAKGGEVV